MLIVYTNCDSIGGKVKPLKAPKKEKKDLDDDEVAFKEKQKAGMISNRFNCILRFDGQNVDLFDATRWEGEKGNDGKGQGQGPYERRLAGHQEVGEEIGLFTWYPEDYTFPTTVYEPRH